MKAFPHSILVVALICSAAALRGGDAVIDQQIADAVEKGKTYLIGLHNGAGAFEGTHKDQIGSAALVVCALRKAGVPPEHEAIQKTLEKIYAYADSKLDADYKLTYNAGICLLALDAIFHTDDAAYDAKPNTKMKSAAEKLAFALFRNRGPRGGWWYVGKKDGDMSCSQYGALGLWAASRLGIPIPANLWDTVAVYVMKVHQTMGGGFVYRERDKPSKSITAASISTLALALRMSTTKEVIREVIVEDYDKGKQVEKQTITVEVKKPKTEVEMAIERGFKWWKQVGPLENNAYYWYATERAYTLTNTQQIDGKPWFEMLATQQILPQQKPDGSWSAGQEPTCDTAWALLALTRATNQMVHNEDAYAKAEKQRIEREKIPAAADAPPAASTPVTVKSTTQKPAAKKKTAADE